ncbi:cytosolic carboxypeptidase 1 isoform X1 [Babesia caballi]|uniref:Cytosolic carboxypeptidase 1 isoform X1 n=1 Tax=Babesia caballi TaxID=5871 RepID=A0AAV4LUI8_BABCB|nr:cytosolic carboxypeptidase 1 isoform X1 [Babesia caballi]
MSRRVCDKIELPGRRVAYFFVVQAIAEVGEQGAEEHDHQSAGEVQQQVGAEQLGHLDENARVVQLGPQHADRQGAADHEHRGVRNHAQTLDDVVVFLQGAAVEGNEPVGLDEDAVAHHAEGPREVHGVLGEEVEEVADGNHGDALRDVVLSEEADPHGDDCADDDAHDRAQEQQLGEDQAVVPKGVRLADQQQVEELEEQHGRTVVDQ